MSVRWLFTGLLIFVTSITFAQTIVREVVPNKSHREGTNFSIPCSTPPLCDYYDMGGWDDSQIKQYTYRGHLNDITGPVVEFLNWRMVFPLNYDPNRIEKYPMIVMLHGAGESGRIWTGRYNYLPSDLRFDNNGHNILHGGQEHLNAVNRNPGLSNSFPGIVIWPQASYNGAWENGWNNGNLNETGTMVGKVVDWIIENINVDPDRIAVHGLSNGGKGTWEMATKRADLFAAALPMSGVGSNNAAMAAVLNTTPLWLFQGGTDTNPRPQAAVDAIAALQAEGGTPKYTLYPNLGHGVWQTAYAEAQFFPWIKAQTKKNIHVFGGDPNICAGNNLQLGFSANMLEYIWYKDNVQIPSSNNRFLTVNQPGDYKVRYRRRVTPLWEADAWGESNPVTIGVNPSTFSPFLTNTGSTVLPTLGGVNEELFLNAPTGYPTYYWFKDGNPTTPIQPASSQTSVNTVLIKNNQGNAGQAGNYTVKVLLPNGCPSEHSNIINVTYGTNGPPAPTVSPNPPVAISPTEINLQWSNVPQATSGYEVWRIRFGSTGLGFESYKLVAVIPANTTSFTDTGLRPEGSYRYRIRSVNSGGGNYSTETNPSTNTFVDLIPPTVPLNLFASNITDSQVTLTWDPSTDNDKVYKYEIYNGATLVHTLTGGAEALTPPSTTHTVTGLSPGFAYNFSVRAIDYRNNYSPFAESVEVNTTAPLNGLTFKYYQFSGTMPGPAGQQLNETTPQTPAAFNFNQTPLLTGTVSNFSLTPRLQNDNFVFAYDGYIEILNTGNHTFFTSSDDGSRLYINGTLVVINDGAHGTQEVSGTYNFTSTGKFPIRVTFFEQGGGEVLEVRWQKNSDSGQFSKQLIPNNRLWLTGTTITTYYLRTGTNGNNPTLHTAWTTTPNGTGSTGVPSSTAVFSQNNTYFVLANRPLVNISNTWAITGTGSKVIAGNGNAIIINLDSPVDATMEASANAIINANNAAVPKFNAMHTSSAVDFAVPSITIPNASYGSITLSAPGQYNLPLSTTVIKGDLYIADEVTTAGVANNLTTLRIGGNLIVDNVTGNPFPVAGGEQYSLIFTGGTTHTASFLSPVNLNLFSIQGDFGDEVIFDNLSSNTITVGSNQGGGLILKGGSILNIGDNNLAITGRGTINPNNETGSLYMEGGSLTYNSTATQNSNLYFAENSQVTNLTSSTPANNQLTLLSNVAVDNLVTVSSGQLNAGEGNLTLRSVSDAANGTARIGPLLNGASVSGKIKMQRYMSGEGRIYRYISSPVAGVTAADLQDFFPITGNFSDSSYGPGLLTNASMFHFDEPSNPQYQQFPSVGGNSLETLQRGKGYVPFIRKASEETVWEVMGEPYQGNIPFTLTGGTGSADDGWNLLGNPYPAPIKWTGSSTGGWTMNGVNNTVYVRENENGTTTVKQHNGSTGTPGWDGVIAPGQAFWVRTTNGSPALSVAENAKQITDAAFLREGAPANVVSIVMKSAARQDGAAIQFVDGATPAFDTNLDGVKLDNTFFNISTLTTDNKPMAINLTTTNYCEQEIKLRITNAAAGSYQLEITGMESLVSGDEVTFIDNFTHTEKVIADSEVYDFSITADAASKADGRFVLRFKKPEVVLNQTLRTDAVCEQDSPVIRVNNSQPGVTYQAFVNGNAVSAGLTSTGGTLELPVNAALVPVGETLTHIKAGFKGCNSYDLPMTIAVQRDTLPIPTILAEPTQLIASTEDATYQWYFNGEEMEGQTSRELLAPEPGLYQVEVSKGTCLKMSDTLDYVVTGIEKPNRLQRLYPNPTRQRVIVEMEQPIDFESVWIITSVGQVIQVPTIRLSAESAEVDLSSLPAGLYLLQVNRERYRVLKE